jgi:diketogulonate reductase-like aldo/keto reductase
MTRPGPEARPAIERRDVLKGMAALGSASFAGLIAAPALAQTEEPVIMQPLPGRDERVPAVGLGTFLTFDVLPGGDRGRLFEVVKRFWDAGGRMIDTSPLYGSGEITVGDATITQGVNGQAFIANKIWSTGEYLGDESHARRSLEQSLGRLWRERLDLMQCHSLVNVDLVLPILRAWKKEGRIRYVGLTHFENAYHAVLAAWLDRGGVDVVQVNYSIANPAAESTVFKAAERNDVAVLVNMPFEKARLFKLVDGREVPAFARDVGIDSWAEFFLKWAISHPAVTCALPATSNPDHLAENMRAMRGRLPDPDMRERMARHVAALPGFAELGKQPWYPGKRYPGLIARAQAEIRSRG